MDLHHVVPGGPPGNHVALSVQLDAGERSADEVLRLVQAAFGSGDETEGEHDSHAPDSHVHTEPEAPAVWCEGQECEGQSVGNPEWADGARLAAQAQLSAGPSRAVVYPGSERMVGTLTIGAVTELSAIDEVRTMGPALAADATLVTRDHVRPLRQDGRWVLHVQPASGGIQVTFEAPANRPCCAEHQ